MRTICPSCYKEHTITVKKLDTSEGEFLCNRCYVTFDPVENLSEKGFFKNKKPIKTEKELQNTDMPLDFWQYGLALCAFIFMLQIFLFEGDSLAQNKILRPWIERICSTVGYPLTPYKNLKEFNIIYVSLDPTDNESYVLNASFINQSDYSQDQPSIKLVLKDFVGDIFAERIFHPDEYSKNSISPITPDMTTKIKMVIAAPENKIGGFHFELI